MAKAIVSPPAVLFAAGLWGFHLGVLVLMAIVFPYPLSGIGFAPLLPAERIWRWRWLSPLPRWRAGTGGRPNPP